MKRTVVPELLDTDSGTPDQVQKSLEDLQWLNRNLGGISTTAHLLHQVAKHRGLHKLSFLDVAGATGDVSAGAQHFLQQRGVELDYAVLDRSAGHLNTLGGSSMVADAFALPFRDGSFDVVGSALFLHHLETEQLLAFFAECLRVSRHACIINDLRRSSFHLLAAYAGRLLYRSAITSHDSAASVRRAYTVDELTPIFKELPLKSFDVSNHFLYRMGVILWK
jgi:ubiquinone/menaquinone biosynthesis C-methylase UbiE